MCIGSRGDDRGVTAMDALTHPVFAWRQHPVRVGAHNLRIPVIKGFAWRLALGS